MKDAILVKRCPAPVGAPYPFALIPADAAAADALGKIPTGETIAVQVRRGRSLQQHRLFFAVLSHVAAATEWETPERLLVAIKVRLGRFDLMKLPNGKVVPVPDSISFSAMKQGEFQSFMDAAVAVICAEVLPGYDPDRLIAEAQHALGVRPIASAEAA